MLVVPFWISKEWWALLHRFRVIDLIPINSDLFTSPLWDNADRPLVFKGPTRWHTLVLYMGPEFHSDRLWKLTQRGRNISSTAEYQRLRKVHSQNLMLSGDPKTDSDAIYHLVDQLAQISRTHGPALCI